MRLNPVIELYSKSLLDCCNAANKLQITEQVFAFLDAYSNSLSLKSFLEKNLISDKKKLDFLLSLGFSDILNNLFSLLRENGRLNFIVSIFEKFLLLVKIDDGEIDTVVTSTIALNNESIELIADVLKSHYNKKKVSVTNIVDTKILGGVIIKVGYIVFDFSILRKIENLSKISKEALKTF